MSLDGISKLLHKEKVIKNPYFFKFWIKINFLEKKLRYGEFSFNKENSIFDVTRKLIYGKTIFRQLTIIEGSYKYDLLEMLKKIDPNTSLNILDIPSNIVADTYYYQVTDSGERILEEIKNYLMIFLKRFGLKEISQFH